MAGVIGSTLAVQIRRDTLMLWENFWAERDKVGTTQWSHVRVIVVADPPPPTHKYTVLSRDGSGRSAFTLTKHTCSTRFAPSVSSILRASFFQVPEQLGSRVPHEDAF